MPRHAQHPVLIRLLYATLPFLLAACSQIELPSATDANLAADGRTYSGDGPAIGQPPDDGRKADDPTGKLSDAKTGGRDAPGKATDSGTNRCSSSGPAYIHGDIWPFWYSGRTACDAPHTWWWVCKQRLGAGHCQTEKQHYQECLDGTGHYGPTDAPMCNDCKPAPHAKNYGQCQPHHWPDKRDEPTRPDQNNNACDTQGFDYQKLSTSDRYYGLDWWGAGHALLRHMTLKVYEQSVDPTSQSHQGQADGLVVLSTHPNEESAFTSKSSNHSYAGSTRQKPGCIPPFTGDTEDPMPDQNFGSFAWVEVPTDRPLNLAVSWHGLDVEECLPGQKYSFPSDFSSRGPSGKPWFTSSPCFDVVRNVQFEPGAHYVWDISGFHKISGCQPPSHVLTSIPQSLRTSFRDGSCNPKK